MNLAPFLAKAKINTYASQCEGGETIFYKGTESYNLDYHGGYIKFK